MKTNETKHTPGPWRCNYGNGTNLKHDVTIWGRNGQTVIGELASDPAFGPEPSDSEMEANARLIASAPELLTALEGLLRCCEAQPEWDDLSGRVDSEGMEFLAAPWIKARAAIAKARGGGL